MKGKVTVFRQLFSSLYIQNWKELHKISFSEPGALFMKFPTRDDDVMSDLLL